MLDQRNARTLAILSIAFVGCFKSPSLDPTTLKCATDDNCPEDYVCEGSSAGVLGTCARSPGSARDAGGADAATDARAKESGDPADAGNVGDGAADNRGLLDLATDEAPTSMSDTGVLDLPADFGEASDAPITGTGGGGGQVGAGGTVGTGGRTGGGTRDAASTGGGGAGGVTTGGTSGFGSDAATDGSNRDIATGAGGSGNGGATGTGGSGSGGGIGSGGVTGTGGVLGSGGTTSPGGCVPGKAWPTANPATTGPFVVAADKAVGPAAGVVPDPVYGDTAQRFNVYRPADLGQGYCHPILLWGNAYRDNPEPNPPLCFVDSAADQYCGQYLPLMNLLASHGFVVVASLSTIVQQPDPRTGLLPQQVGMDWIIQQNDDPASPYYHRLDTAHIGATGHSGGGLATSKIASDPRVLTIATIAGVTPTPAWLGPALLLCGGNDSAVTCSSVQRAFDAITATPVMLGQNPAADHVSWIYGTGDPYQVAVTAWMRVHLMGDQSLRSKFYGADCGLCQDPGLIVQRKNMDQ